MYMPNQQYTFSIALFVSLFYDLSLLSAILIRKYRDTQKEQIPVVYIFSMLFCGIVNKISIIMLFDGYIISNWMDPENEYQEFMGRELTLIGSFGYLTPIDLNLLMTINKLSVVFFPKNRLFTNRRLIIYCLITMITDFQNKFTIFLPATALFVNVFIVLYFRYFSDIGSKNPESKSKANRGKYMIRSTLFISICLSIYEAGKTFIRVYPETFEHFSESTALIFQYIRILSFCYLNFIVYFLKTESTRKLILEFYGYKRKKNQVDCFIVMI
ncbi:hypothetical protein CAEBREN_01922 [Caenorhabditis brenneri]|uniref:G-protein coupled receptors family 1 profile domain-containing protein n=1 Tax=Caenorhabditis brenneri TaxID=135651 RepID=G0MEJ6_CAEBE|nr:hypothetical protein CAEBREN_01922 [Caenorhabditis brenneri]